MPHGIQARDRFLAEITPFGEGDALASASDFLSEILVADVTTINRKARFDPPGFKFLRRSIDAADRQQALTHRLQKFSPA